MLVRAYYRVPDQHGQATITSTARLYLISFIRQTLFRHIPHLLSSPLRRGLPGLSTHGRTPPPAVIWDLGGGVSRTRDLQKFQSSHLTTCACADGI